MAIVFKNPMPSVGALFVSNPRKRKNRKPRRRSNSGQPKRSAKFTVMAMVADGIKPTAAVIKGMSQAKFDQYKTAGRALKEATKGQGGLKMLQSRPKGKKMFKVSEAVERAVLARLSVVKKRYQTQKKGVQTPPSSRLTALDRRHKGRKTTSIFKGDESVVPSFSRSRPSVSRSPAQVKAQEKQGAIFKMAAKFIKDGMSKKDANKLAKDMYEMYETTGMSTVANPWYGAKGHKGGHAGAAYMRWNKAKGKKLLAAYHKRKKRAEKGKKVKAKAGSYAAMFAKVSQEKAGRKFKSNESRMKAIHREVKKRMKKGGARPASARKKTSKARKKSIYQRTLSMFKGTGVSHKQMVDIYESLGYAEMRQVKKELAKIKKKKSESAAAHKKRVQAAAKKLIAQPNRTLAGKFVAVNPKRKKARRKNPLAMKKNALAMKKNRRRKSNPRRRKNGVVNMGMDLVSKLQQSVEKIPVVRHAAFIITPVAAGLTLAYAHQFIEPIAVPLVMKGLDAAEKLPVVGGVARVAAEKAASNPYLVTGIAVSVVSGLVAGFAPKVLSAKGAMALGGGAIAVGAVLDHTLKPFAKAAAQVAVEATQAAVSGEEVDIGGFGDGGAYMVGAPTSALGPSSFGAIGLDSSQMGALAMEYSDANMLDSHQTTEDFHPDEVAALLAGSEYFQKKFGVSPSRLRKTIHDYSRHAGRPGHRWGWLIKMIGFHNVQKIAALQPHQRHYVLRQLKKQAKDAAPQLISQAEKRDLGAIETAGLDLAGSFNGAGGAYGSSYGALMFAGNNY